MFPAKSFGLAAVVGALAVSGSALAQEPPLAADLKNPRGLFVSGDALLIAEQGAGRIVSVGADGTPKPVIEGVASGSYTSPEGPTVVGANAVILVGDTYYFTVAGSLGAVAGSGAVYSAKAGEQPKLIADLWKYEEDNNTLGDTTPEGQPDIDSNPYDLVSDGADGLYVTDAAANTIFHISEAGEIKPYAEFPDRDNPLAGKVGGPKIDQVPTGLTKGPDGAVYVSTLTGFPFANGAARVYRVADGNSDGDALDDGEVTVFAEGLTTATDLAFGADGTLYVTEFSTDMLKQAPGRLVSVKDGKVTEVAAPLVSPTAVAALHDGKLAVTQEFPGVVVAVSP